MNIDQKLIIRLSIAVLLLTLLGWLGYQVFTYNKVLVTFDAEPSQTNILLDGKKIKDNSRHYLDRGSTHTVEGTASGYSAYKEEFTVSDTPITIGVLPKPDSEAAFSATQDQEVSLRRERLGGVNANRRGLAFELLNPLFNLLPYTDDEGLFTINVGVDENRTNGGFISIDNSSTEGRKRAIEWIRERGYNPTELDIRYKDFVNPLVNRAQAERGF